MSTILEEKLQEFKKEYIDAVGKDKAYACDFLNNSNIWNSKLYKFCKDIPKGGDDHVHGLALLPAKELVEFVLSEENLVISTEKSTYGLLRVKSGVKKEELESKNGSIASFMSLKDALDNGIYTKDELIKMWTLAGITNDILPWDYFEGLFTAHSELGDEPVVTNYYVHAFEYYYSLNIKHIELKVFFFGDHECALRRAQSYKDAYYIVRRRHPDFRVSFISMGLKVPQVPLDVDYMLLDNTAYVREHIFDDFDKDNIKPLVIAFDLVNEEDASRPLVEMRDVVNKAKELMPDIILTLHAGESNLPDSNNLIEAYNMGSVRVGHGYNLFKFPELKEKFIKEKIILEVCPVSNNILGYAKDLRKHPAREYFREGVAMVIASDDPAYEMHSALVDDYFAIIMNWDLNIDDVKTLARNSITYSLFNDKDKEELYRNFERDWDEFERKYRF